MEVGLHGLVVACLISLFQLHVVRSQYATDNKTELYIAFITSYGKQYNSSGTVPALELALEEINNSSEVLRDYKLSLFKGRIGDSQCERMESLNSFLDMITTGPPKLAVLGCGCSVATEPVAEISDFWNITHISYASSSSSLNERVRFPNFWRTYPSEDNIVLPILAVLMQYGWNQLKIITQDETLFTLSTEQLRSDLRNAGMTVDMNGTTTFRTRDNVATAENLFAASRAREEFDPAFHYRSYVWITLGWYHQLWWTVEAAQDDQVNCTDTELDMLLERTIAVQHFPTAENRTASTDVSLTAEEFLDDYTQRLNSSEGVYNFEFTAYHIYDAAWTLAFAMNNSIIPLADGGLSLEDFNYQTTAQNISQEIQEQLNSTDFQFRGVSGLVAFNDNGTRLPTRPQILKYRDSSVINNCGEAGPMTIERVVVGGVSVNDSQFVYRRCEDNNTTWTVHVLQATNAGVEIPQGGVPSDGTPVQAFREVSRALFICYTILASVGIVFALICLLFNIIFRKRRIIRLMSPALNNLIVVGAILLYIATYFFVIPTAVALNQTVYCHIRAWTQFIGYSMCFGTIVAKVWRVYRIFHRRIKSGSVKGTKDWHLLLLILFLAGVSVVILVFMEGLDMYAANPVRDLTSVSTRNSDYVLVEYYVQMCDGRNSLVWIILGYVYLLLMQIVAVFLAFITRRVKIKALNESKYITLISYSTALIIIVLLICAITLDNSIDATAGVFGGLIITSATIILAAEFVPKMVMLYRDPQGTQVYYKERKPSFTNAYSSKGKTTSFTLRRSSLTEHHRVMELEAQCQDLEMRLAEYERNADTQLVESAVHRARSSYEPQPRCEHVAVPVGRNLNVWGGNAGSGEKSQDLATTVEVFDVSTNLWKRNPTNGVPPPGLFGTAYTVVGTSLYVFGGRDRNDCLQNSLYKLDLFSFQWEEIRPANSSSGPQKKQSSRMVPCGDNQLLVFAGCTASGYTDELHLFDLAKGKWSSPTVTGTRPPPLAHFSFTKVSSKSAVVYGGRTAEGNTGDVYVLDLDNWNWSKLETTSGPHPCARESHAAFCIAGPSTEQEHPLLVVVGGSGGEPLIGVTGSGGEPLIGVTGSGGEPLNDMEGSGGEPLKDVEGSGGEPLKDVEGSGGESIRDVAREPLKDMWVLDIDKGVWSEVNLSEDVQPRCAHTATIFGFGPKFRMMVLFGGKVHGDPIAETTLIDLECCGGTWEVKRTVGKEELERLVERLRDQTEKLQLPTDINYYDLEFVEMVGSGGFGEVWKGKLKSNERIVAIKKIKPGALEEREVQILSSLDHPHIIRLYGIVTGQPIHYGECIVTEFAENGSIFDYLHTDHQKPTLEQSLVWAKQVAQGMIYLHQKNVLHRDLKSSNVVLTATLTAKICDLGSARTFEHTAHQTTIVGTYAWMAPEMMKRDPVSKACDVYSYGILCWELLSQEKPFSHVIPQYMVLFEVLKGERPPIPKTCEPYLAELMIQCWYNDPKARPSFETILEMLERKS